MRQIDQALKTAAQCANEHKPISAHRYVSVDELSSLGDSGFIRTSNGESYPVHQLKRLRIDISAAFACFDTGNQVIWRKIPLETYIPVEQSLGGVYE